jgi:nucleoside-diphosphate-sugar epimerase
MRLWAITGGAGFLGRHLAARLLAEGHRVRSLDLDPSGPPEAERIVGDVRDPRSARALCAGAEILVHAAAALPIAGSRVEIRSVNVDGTRTILAAAAAAGVRRVVFVSSAVVLPRPIEPYGLAKAEAERLCGAFGDRGLEVATLRPQAFVGPGRLGVFGILFRWIAEGRRIYTLGPGTNRYQLLDVDDLVDAILLGAERPLGGPLALGAARYGTVAGDLRALVEHARSPSAVTPLPAAPARAVLRLLDLAGLSPLSAWHYRTAGRDCLVDIGPARERLGWAPRHSNVETLARAYDWYVAHRDELGSTGTTHRVVWGERALGLVRRVS